MKVLSLLQPWATLVVEGVKKIETRSWQTSHRGRLLIHASQGKKGGILATEPPFKKYIPQFSQLSFGAIIGSVTLDDVFPVERLFLSDQLLASLTMEEKAFGDYTKGRYAWMLSEPEIFTQPILVKGALSLWEFDFQE